MFKIVPMEGATPVNGEAQKGAADLLAEVEIALALSGLRGPLGGLQMLQACRMGLREELHTEHPAPMQTPVERVEW